MSEKISVKIHEKGPIQLSGFSEIHYGGKAVETKDMAFLCRCGNSSNPPFCDGTHKKQPFDDANQLQEHQPVKDWQGQRIQTHFNANLCMHARNCKTLGKLRKLETSGDENAAEEIARVVATCPSGALTYELTDKPQSEFSSSKIVDVIEGGEVRLQCDVELNGFELLDGQPENRVTLCRCGQSKNKPFCDASHQNREGFK